MQKGISCDITYMWFVVNAKSLGWAFQIKGALWSFWPLVVLRKATFLQVGPCFVCTVHVHKDVHAHVKAM